MLENPSSDPIATVKCYAPPNRRNRSLGRRKSGGDRLERVNSYGSEGERTSDVTKGVPNADHGDTFHGSRSKLISIHGCSKSEAFQLLSNRWTAAMNSHDSLLEDSQERPVLYVRKSAPAWDQPMLPHLIMHSAAASERDFLSELRQAMQNANA